MRIVRFQEEKRVKIGIWEKEGIIDFSGAWKLYNWSLYRKEVPEINSLQPLLKEDLFHPYIFQEVLHFLEKHRLREDFTAKGEVRFLSPLCPGKIIALGLNYAPHAREGGFEIPDEPIYFPKASTALIGPGEPIVFHSSVGRVDPEVEMAVIIGRKAKKVPLEEAHQFIGGYTVLNDVTARDIQSKDIQAKRPWYRSKSPDTFCPLGPCITLPDEIKEPAELDLELRVNGEMRQKDNTRNLIFNVEKLISTISQLITLEPGDVISTGTPAGIAPIFPGDIVEAEVEKIGILRNPVKGEE